jgi:hypothetical protein
MTLPHAQIHCCHWDLGRFEGVCGEAGGGVVRDGPLGALAHQKGTAVGTEGSGGLIQQFAVVL